MSFTVYAMVQVCTVATSRAYRKTVGYSAIFAGRVGTYYPYRLYAYCYAPGVGLPPYRGRTVPRTLRPWTRRLVRAFRVVYRISQWGESCCRLQLFLCLVVEIWIMWDGCSVFGAAQPLASPCQGEGDRRRRWKGGYVAESDIVTTRGRMYCSLYETILRPSTSPPPSQLR